jgi:Cd2+/Zn2+-exporting ATPase/Cu+-exporting ATPase
MCQACRGEVCLIKGGKYLEALARADVLLLDKTGTLTLGQPRITDVVSLNGLRQDELLTLAASAERYSEHPLAEAVRVVARERGLTLRPCCKTRWVSVTLLGHECLACSRRPLGSYRAFAPDGAAEAEGRSPACP